MIPYDDDNFEIIQLVGFRVNPEPDDLIIYALVLYYEVARGDKNRPLTNDDGRIVVFTDVRSVNTVLSHGDSAFRKYAPISVDGAYIYDVPKVLATIASGVSDSAGDVVDLINELLDFADATPFSFPSAYRTVLESFADHATFNADIAAYFDTDHDSRTILRDAILWMIGAISMRLNIVT